MRPIHRLRQSAYSANFRRIFSAFLGGALCLLADMLPATAGPPSPAVKIAQANGAPEQFLEFEFPADALLAEILYPTNFIDLQGRKRRRTDRVLARGRFRLPRSASLNINLKYDATSNMQYIEKLKACHVIAIDASKLDLGDAEFAHLKDFKSLQFLNLFDCLITDKSLELIGSLPDIKMLTISHTGIHGDGFKQLHKLKKLENLFVSTLKLNKGALADLKPVAGQLTRLNCGHCALSSEDIAILQSMPKLKMLDISANLNVDNSAVKYLAHLKELIKLNLEDTKIDDKSLPVLLKLPHLEKLYVRERTFWRRGSQKYMGARPKILDASTTSDTSPEILAPLH